MDPRARSPTKFALSKTGFVTYREKCFLRIQFSPHEVKQVCVGRREGDVGLRLPVELHLPLSVLGVHDPRRLAAPVSFHLERKGGLKSECSRQSATETGSFVTLNAKIPLTLFTRSSPLASSAALIPSKITADLKSLCDKAAFFCALKRKSLHLQIGN